MRCLQLGSWGPRLFSSYIQAPHNGHSVAQKPGAVLSGMNTCQALGMPG